MDNNVMYVVYCQSSYYNLGIVNRMSFAVLEDQTLPIYVQVDCICFLKYCKVFLTAFLLLLYLTGRQTLKKMFRSMFFMIILRSTIYVWDNRITSIIMGYYEAM